eukprot:30918-Pelagococcus_subviridis.AAC.34
MTTSTEGSGNRRVRARASFAFASKARRLVLVLYLFTKPRLPLASCVSRVRERVVFCRPRQRAAAKISARISYP